MPFSPPSFPSPPPAVAAEEGGGVIKSLPLNILCSHLLLFPLSANPLEKEGGRKGGDIEAWRERRGIF